MSKSLKMTGMTILVILGIFLIYRVLFIRTVNYNIGGIDIPARYNTLTGKAVPISGYKGKPIKATVTDRKSNKVGLDSNDVTAAQFRWELFEGWVNNRPEYKGWESDQEIFKKANKKFKDSMQANVKVIN